jgi:hypothetical protein
MDVTPSGGTWTITLPPANEVSSGRDFLMRNLGAVAFNVVDNASGALATIAAGESRYFYITSNSTAAGSWSVFTYGTGTSSADASALDGYGLTVLSGTLNTDLPISGIGATYTISATDRAQFLVYQGGTGTWYWPDPTMLPNGFFCAINNAGTGTLTIDANTAGGYIDEANTKTIQPGESCLIVNKGDATGCFTIGYGRSTEFAFTQLSIDVTGTGGITITSAQAANKLWYFYNTAGGDRTVTIPAVASVYFVRVGAIGAGNELTFTTGSGSTVALSANQSYTIYCDGTNVVSAQTVAVTSTVSLDDGTAATPSISFSLDTDTGFYRAGTNELGITANGTMVATFGTAGLTLATPLTVANGGTGRATSTTAYGLIAAGTTATGVHQTLPAGATTEILVGGGASALPEWTTATGSGAPVRATTPTLVTPILGTPTSGTLTNCTGLPVSTGVSGLGAGIADFLVTPSSANLATAVTDETGSGALVFANTPTLVTPVLGTPTSGTLTNCAGLPLSTGITGTLAIGNGGTGQTTATAAFDALAPTTTKGDLIAHDGTDNVRVGAGTNGYVLAADSTAAPGVAWKSAVSLGVLTLPVSVANGGTGATDAATARTNLGAGDINGPAASVDSEVALFDSTTGKLLKRASMTGTPYITSGVLGTNKVTFTQPATGATLTLADGSTLTTSGAYSWQFTVPGAYTYTLPGATSTLASLSVAQSWTAQQTFQELKDTVYTITDGAAFEIDPANGSIQIVTLGASRTPAATNFEAGQTVLLGIDDGSAYTVTWTTVNPTWVKPGGTASAPTLATTGYTWVLLWKVGSTIYAAEVGKP